MQLLQVQDLGKMSYASALQLQRQSHAQVLAGRPNRGQMQLLLLEHDPQVITVSRRPNAAQNVLVSPQRLADLGIECVETDRGGDVTWHGPGQLVAYPILDLERMGLRIHGYMRLLEATVIQLLADFGVESHRDSAATGVWVRAKNQEGNMKICAMGVRVSRWVCMHGLALNVSPDLDAFKLIVPCGLAQRGVTSMRECLGEKCPSMDEVKEHLARILAQAVASHIAAEINPAGQVPS